MEQRERKIGLIVGTVAVILVLILFMSSRLGHKSTKTPNPNPQSETTEMGKTVQEIQASETTSNQREKQDTENDQSIREQENSPQNGSTSSNGDSMFPAGSHQTTNADGTTETVLPAEPLKPTKVEKPGKKPAGSQGESQMGSQGGNQSQIVDGDKPQAQSGTPTEKPGQNPSSQTGATTPTGSGGTGSDYPSQGEAGDSNGGGVELPIILFD